MTNVFLGQITMFGGNYNPRGFAFCNGQTLPIAQNQALFSLLGTTYGGNGTTTFALPNLQSRLSVHQGQGPGLSSYALGQNGGTPDVTLTAQTIPTHTHPLSATNTPATSATITGNLPAVPTAGTTPEFYAKAGAGDPPLIPHPMDPGSCSTVGGSQPHTNLMPSLCITFIIALQGIFPSRN